MRLLLAPVLSLLVCFAQAPFSARAADRTVVRVGLPQQPNTLNPLVGSQFFENYIDEALYSGLTVVNDRGEVTPDLAESLPTRANGGISADGLVLVYRLRPNLRWHDGVPLTADDVVFTFERIRDPKTGFPAETNYDIVEKVEARDPRTVVLHLRKPSADAVAVLFVNGQNGSIVPRHAFQGTPDVKSAPFNEHPVGSGPFAFKSWQRDAQLVLEASPTYFRGRPKIDELHILFVPDTGTMAIKLRAGELDFAPAVTPTAVEMLRSVPNLKLLERPTLSLLYLTYRVDVAPFDDAALRHALALAIDREALARTAYLGHADGAAELVPPWSPFATFKTAQRQQLAAAKSMLDAAGWRPQADEIRAKNGQRLHVVMTTIAGSRAQQAMAIQLQAAWKAIGVEVDLRPMQANVVYAPDGVGARGDFSVLLTGFGFATTPDRGVLISSESIPPAGSNYARYRNAEVDRDVAQSRVALDPAVRRRAFARIAQRIRADEPYVPILWGHVTVAAVRSLSGVRPEPVNSDFWNVYDWKL